MNIKEEYIKITTWYPTNLRGLKGTPILANEWNNRDCISELPFNWTPPVSGGNGQFSDNNKQILIDLIQNKPNATLFVEIGTATCFEGSSTDTFIRNKKDETTFVTIDITKRSSETLNKPNVIYAVGDSTDPNIKSFFDDEKIDLLFIDGDHSVDTVFKEYQFYLPLMKKDGIIVLHDTTMHPGPYLFMQAIDENVFRKEVLCTDDLGMGIVYLK